MDEVLPHPSNADMQRSVPGNSKREQSHPGQCLVLQPYGNSTIFRDRATTRTDLDTDVCFNILYDFHRLMWEIAFITFLLFVCITSVYLRLSVILTQYFSNFADFIHVQIQNDITKFYLLTPKQIIIQLEKLQLKLDNNFRHCRIFRLPLHKGVSRWKHRWIYFTRPYDDNFKPNYIIV